MKQGSTAFSLISFVFPGLPIVDKLSDESLCRWHHCVLFTNNHSSRWFSYFLL